MGNRPEVSVCIPVFNGASSIRESIQSVLGQTGCEFELVVVDNCSTDGTYELIREVDDPRLRVVRNDTNIGMVPNWNRTLELASGEYIKVMAHDDVLLSGCVSRQAEALRSEPAVVLVASRRSIIDADGVAIKRDWGLGRLSGVVSGEAVAKAVVRSGRNLLGEGMAVMFRADRSRQVGGFSDRWPYVADLEYWMRLLKGSSMFALTATLAAFRLSTQSLSAASVGSEQSRQVRALLSEVSAEFPDRVSRMDVLIGSARARAYAQLRRLLYSRLRRRQ